MQANSYGVKNLMTALTQAQIEKATKKALEGFTPMSYKYMVALAMANIADKEFKPLKQKGIKGVR